MPSRTTFRVLRHLIKQPVKTTNKPSRASWHMRFSAGVIAASTALMLAGAAMPANPARAQSPDPLRVERQITPENGLLGQGEFTVTLTLTGNAASCPPRVSNVQNDIVL